MPKQKAAGTKSTDADTPLSELTPAQRCIRDINAYERDFKAWEDRGKGIIDRYRDVRLEPVNQTFVLRKFNIFWANIETLRQTLYARVPKLICERQFKDADITGRYASEIVERMGNYIIKTSDFDDVMKDCVQDLLLPGRAVPWIAYESDGDETEVTEEYTDEETGVEMERPKQEINPETGDPITNDDGTPKIETEYHKISEAVRPVYLHWKDFGHSPVRKWSECKRVWRRIYLGREKCVERFGAEKGNEIPLDKPRDNKGKFAKSDYLEPKATIYEVYDKDAQKVFWIHKDLSDEPLDESDPPIELEEFWPIPKPIWATMTNDTLIPIPDFVLYQDQANELDEITNRIARIVDAIRICGTYDSSVPALERILQPNGAPDNILVPVDSWAAFAEKGGLKGAIDLVPLDMLAMTLKGLYEARDQIKAIIYEVTGISDIIRGATDPNETLGAQDLKVQTGSVRIRARQAEVAALARDTGRIIVECGLQMFEPKTIWEMVMGESFIPIDAQDQQLMAYAKQNGLDAPLPKVFLDALKMLKDDKLRSFHIDIETDSTIALNEMEDKQARLEFAEAVGGLLEKSAPLVQQNPVMAPFIGEMLLYVARGFHAGRSMEGAIEQMVKKIESQAQQAEQAKAQGKTPPDPKMLDAQARMLEAKSDAQNQQQDNQREAANDQAKNQREAAYDQTDLALRAQNEAREAKLGAADVLAKISPIAGAHMAVAAVTPQAPPAGGAPPPPRPAGPMPMPARPGVPPPLPPGATPLRVVPPLPRPGMVVPRPMPLPPRRA